MTVLRAAALVAAGSLASASAGYALSAGGDATPVGKNLTGKQLYRKYCGQCHALRAALAAGFGTENGLGTNGGPDFNNLRVPFNLSVLAVTQPFIGHEVLVHKMSWAQIQRVSRFVQTATRHHSVLAQNIDG